MSVALGVKALKYAHNLTFSNNPTVINNKIFKMLKLRKINSKPLFTVIVLTEVVSWFAQ